MSLSNNKVSNSWQNGENSTGQDSYFLAHELEPIDNHKSFAPDEIKQELYENRFFLKRRVWRNMRKIRRNHQMGYRFSGPQLKTLKPYHIR